MDKTIFLVDLDHTLYNVETEILYDDAIEFISYLNKIGTPILFTEGELDFQKAKVERLGLSKYFGKNIMIFESFTKMSEFNPKLKYEKIVLIDDKSITIEEARKRKWITIRVQRGKYKSTSAISDYTVPDLKSIIGLKILNEV